MNEPIVVQKEYDHGKAVIIAGTIIIMTCILSCASVLMILIFRLM
jgi:hypothetical protein